MLRVRCFSIAAFLMLGVWGLHELRPFVQVLSGPLTCCLECKRNYCPARKPEAPATASCHHAETSTKSKMNRTCNHSSDFQVLHPDGILVQGNFSVQNHVYYHNHGSSVFNDSEAIPPASPPPKNG